MNRALDEFVLKWLKENVTRDNVDDNETFLKLMVLLAERRNGILVRIGWSLIHFAIRRKLPQCIDYLLQIADIETRTGAQSTPLMITCMDSYEYGVRALLNANANIHVEDHYNKGVIDYLLENASHHEQSQTLSSLKLLIDRGAKLPANKLHTAIIKFITNRNNNRQTTITFIGLHKYKRVKNQNTFGH
jgi:hypothetical protein